MFLDHPKTGITEALRKSLLHYMEQHYVENPRELFAELPAPMACPKQELKEPPSKKRLTQNVKARDTLPVEDSCGLMETYALASLEEILKQEDAGFSETLLRLIDQSGKKDSQVYKQANLSKQHFSKIRNNPHYKPTKPTAIALALALELDLEATRDLIGRAGYALTNSSKFDLIIRYFIENRIYDVMQINLALCEFDQPLLGGV